MKWRKQDVRFVVWILGVALLGVILAFGKIPNTTNSWDIDIQKTGEGYFEEKALLEKLSRCEECKDIQELEAQLQTNPWVKNVNVYHALDGTFGVYIEEHTPSLRLLSWNAYLSLSGKLLPTHAEKVFRSPVVTGVLPNRSDTAFWKGLTHLGRYLNEHPFWLAQIQQLNVNKNQEVVLIPRVGNHSIVLGTCTRIERKFEQLKLLYVEGFPHKSWYDYKEINISLSNQIVCTKR